MDKIPYVRYLGIFLALKILLLLAFVTFYSQFDIKIQDGGLNIFSQNNNEASLKQRPFSSQNYRQDCIALYLKLRNPDRKLIFKPPLKYIPAEMYADFTQNGLLPNKKYWYFDDAYSDSFGNFKFWNWKIKQSRIDNYVKKIKKNEPLGYGDKTLNELMHAYGERIRGDTVIVIGTVNPWVESIAYELEASQILSLDYTRKTSEVARLKWMHVNDYLDEAILESKLEHIANAVSFSSIEHAGLGRFGDPLAPYGDIEAVQQVRCMLKPGGLFFLAVPVSSDNSSYLQFNAHRVYGTDRLKLMFEGWNLLESKRDTFGLQMVFVLEKIPF
jgi:hypothetical protein